MPQDIVALGLGSNVGDSAALLMRAIERLAELCGPLAVAPLYSSAPISPIAQDDFANTVVIARRQAPGLADLDGDALLNAIKSLEVAFGRRCGPRWGPRSLDIDLLLLGNERIETPRLTVPHSQLRHRAFVLAPLADLVPWLPLPEDGLTVAEALAALGTSQQLERRCWPRPFATAPWS